jgi:hypothetical protein
MKAFEDTTRLTNLSLRIHPDLVFQRLDDQALLLNMQTNQIYEMNQTAARFWELLSTHADLKYVQEQLMDEFEIEATQLAEETQAILSFLQAEALIYID